MAQTREHLSGHELDALRAVIGPSQVAFLTVAERASPVDGQPAVQPTVVLGLSLDHRVADGALRAQSMEMLDTSAQRQERLNKAIDRIRQKYGFTAIQTGRTLKLKDIFPESGDGYTLQTPSLSR